MSSILLAAAVFSLLPLILAYPHVGILGWYWIGLQNPHREAWGPLTTVPFAAVIAATTLLAWFVSREPKRIPMNAVTVSLALLAIWITWTTTQAQVPEFAWEKWDKSIKIILLTFVTIALMHTRERMHALVWVTVLGLGYFGIKGGLFTILSGGIYHVKGPPNSFIGENNALALALLMTLPLLRYLHLNSGSKWIRRAMLAAIVLFIFSIIGSQSRGAFLGLIATSAFLIWKSRYRVRLFALAAVLGFTAIWFVPDSWVERMESIKTYEEDQSAMQRIRTWRWAIDLAVQRPFTGGGFEVYRDRNLYMSMVPDAVTNHNFHSVYFEVIGQHGFIGFIIFAALAVCTWRMFRKTIKLTDGKNDMHWAHDLARMGHVSMIAYFVTGAFLNLAFFDLYYIFVALSVTLYGHVERVTAAEAGVDKARLDSPSRHGNRPARPAPARLRPGLPGAGVQRSSS